jgi:ubiquinone biosynthesis protein UbiJ
VLTEAAKSGEIRMPGDVEVFPDLDQLEEAKGWVAA